MIENESDALLIGRIVNGETDAVRPLVERYGRALMAFIARATPDQSEDIFQEAWIRVVRSAASYDPSYRFSTWLFRIAWNLVRSDWKSRERTPEPYARDEAYDAGHDDRLVREETAARVRQLVGALPPRLSEAVFLRFFEELSEKEMAERLGVPTGTVKSRIHHALKKLASSFKEEPS